MLADKRLRPPAAALIALATTLLLASCGGEPEGFDDADIAYATDVTTHHAQTLQVLDLSLGRERLDPALGQYAEETRQALFAEVDTTQKLLKQWDRPVPRTALQHTHTESYEYDTSVPGVLSADELHALEQTMDARFEETWVAHLVSLEEGAVELAQTAVDEAQNADAVAAAEKDLAAHQERLEQLREHAA